MKSGVVLVLCVVLLFGLLSACFADEGTGMNGRSELMASAAWARVSDGGSIDATLVGVNYGKFVAPKIEAQLGVVYAKLSGGIADISATLLTPAVAYHFVPETPSTVVPYVGVGLAYANVSGLGSSDNSTKFQYFAGAKFFLNGNYNTANKAVFLEYRHTSIGLFGADLNVDAVMTGLSCYF